MDARHYEIPQDGRTTEKLEACAQSPHTGHPLHSNQMTIFIDGHLEGHT